MALSKCSGMACKQLRQQSLLSLLAPRARFISAATNETRGVTALAPLHQKFKLKKVLMNTYTSNEAEGHFCFPSACKSSKLQSNGYSNEEMQTASALKKFFGLPEAVTVACTSVRVPTLSGLSESVTIETELPICAGEAEEMLRNVPGVQGIRQSALFGKHGLEFFVSNDASTTSAEHAVQMPASSLHGPVAWGMHKFGGASLADTELFRTCGDILIGESTRNKTATPTAAVVSAMKGMTDRLVGVVEAATKAGGEAEAKKLLAEVVHSHIETARELLKGHPDLVEAVAANISSDSEDISALLRSVAVLKVVPNSTMEFVAGMGEIWSAQLLQGYLKTKGVPTAWLNARDVLVVESNSSGLGAKGAALDMRVEPNYVESANRLETWWQQQDAALRGDSPPIVVVTGFVASTMEGVPTTLKRSGSDYSATIFARLLKASQVTMWKNVDGVYSADPGAVSEAATVNEMSYDEAIELAYFGGQVLHPTAMEPSMADNTPVYVRNVFNPTFEGTKISRTPMTELNTSKSAVKCITSIPNIAMVNVNAGSWASVSKVTRKVMGAMDDAGVKVVLATQACASHSISVAVDEAQGERAVSAIKEAFQLELARGNIQGVVQESGYSIIAAVGDDLKDSVGTLGKITGSLARTGVSISAMAPGSSGRTTAVVVERSKMKSAMLAIHEEFSGTAAAKRSMDEDIATSTDDLRRIVEDSAQTTNSTGTEQIIPGFQIPASAELRM